MLLQYRVDALLLVVERDVGTNLAQEVEFFLLTRRADDLEPIELGKLDHERTNRSRGGRYVDRLTLK